MNPRINYEMTEKQLEMLLDACKPTPVIMIGGYAGSSPQENANRAWRKLGEEMGFDSETVQPISGKGYRFFSAVPSETEEQRKERLDREREETIKKNISRLESEIKEKQDELSKLLSIT